MCNQWVHSPLTPSFTLYQSTMSNPRVPKRGELPPGGGLQRSKAVRRPRRGSSSDPTQNSSSTIYGEGSSGPSRGDQSFSMTSLIDNDGSPSQSGLSVSRHAPNTTAHESLLTNGVGIPPNLLGLEGAVRCNDFTSGTDGGKHALKREKVYVLDKWRNESAKYLVSIAHIPEDHLTGFFTDHPSD